MNHLNDNARLAGEQRFAYKLRQLLTESADAIPADRMERLAEARKAALRAHKPAPTPALSSEWLAQHIWVGAVQNGGGSLGGPERGRRGLAFAAIVLVGASLVGLFQFEQQQRADEQADVDAGVLTDDLPISAYADHGFNAFLKQNQ